MPWPQLVLTILVCWTATAILVGTVVGHGIAYGSPDRT
jgi:hypothetical protein